MVLVLVSEMRGSVLKRRVRLETGWVETATSEAVQVGDHLVPCALTVDLPGADGQPGLRMRLEVIDGTPQCREFTIHSVDGGRGVRQSDVQAVKLTQWIDEFFALFAYRRDVNGTDWVTEIPTKHIRHLGAVKDLHAATRRQPRKLDRMFLQQVADIYRANISHNPTQAVADEFGKQHRQAANYVQRARAEGLLGQTTRGRKGG